MIAQTELPVLPEELARKIVELLSNRDVCSATLACKAFWYWGNALSFVSTSLRNRRSAASLLQFQARRAPVGLKVENLHLWYMWHLSPRIINDDTIGELRMNIQLCSATLTALYLEGLSLEQCFSKCLSDLLPHAGSASSDLKDTICQCKQLCSLHIAFEPYPGNYEPPDASSLLMDLSAALPNLAALQWRELPHDYRDKRSQHLSPAFVARVAAESPNGSGLRLLQADKCSFDRVSALPASLQVLSIWNGQVARYSLLHRFALLLAPCAALRELYILHTHKSTALDLSAVAAACPALRVLVLHVLLQYSQVAPYNKGDTILPELEVLLVTKKTYMETTELMLRAPALKVLAMDIDGNASFAALEIAWARLQYLQLSIMEFDYLRHDFWRALKPCTELAALQVIFLPESSIDEAIDLQVCRFLGAALTVGPLCLPKLAKLALFLELDEVVEQPIFWVSNAAFEARDQGAQLQSDDDDAQPLSLVDTSAPEAQEEGAQRACNVIGQLVTAGVLPALAQVLLYPCGDVCEPVLEEEDDPEWEEDDPKREEERGPHCDGATGVDRCRLSCAGAVGVDVICRQRMSNKHPLSAFALLKPELGSALNEAALRAYGTLDRGPDRRFV